MRLIAYVQNNMKIDEEYIVYDMQVEIPIFQGVDPSQYTANASAFSSSQDEVWRIKPEDRVNYDKVFNHFDKDGSGTLTDTDMQQVLVMTKSSKPVCAQVWELSNPEGEEIFTKPMFMIAMHLLY